MTVPEGLTLKQIAEIVEKRQEFLKKNFWIMSMMKQRLICYRKISENPNRRY